MGTGMASEYMRRPRIGMEATSIKVSGRRTCDMDTAGASTRMESSMWDSGLTA